MTIAKHKKHRKQGDDKRQARKRYLSKCVTNRLLKCPNNVRRMLFRISRKIDGRQAEPRKKGINVRVELLDYLVKIVLSTRALQSVNHRIDLENEEGSDENEWQTNDK